MTHLAAALAAALLLSGVPAPAAAERITAFSVALALSADGSLEVVEDVTYDFEDARRHGIYREIPVRYERRWGDDFRIDLDVESVSDAEGRSRPYRVRSQGRSVRIRIGSPDRKLTGRQHYRIRYRVRRALLFLDEHDEVYWNVTGNDWRVRIDAVDATLRLPPGPEGGLDPASLATRCFTGPLGSRGQACRVASEAGRVAARATAALPPGSGLTLVVGLPKGVVAEPGPVARVLDRLRAWGGAWLLAPLAALVGMFGLWRARGRDPHVADAVVVRYEPPEGISPAEVGTLLDERVDVDDVTSTILDLAVRGHLRIVEVEARGFLFLSDQDYDLERLDAGDDPLRPHEAMILDALFGRGERVRLSSLKDRFHRDLERIVESIERGLTGSERHFVHSPRRVRRFWRGAAFAVGVAAFLAGANGVIPLGGAIAVAASALVIAGFGRAMPRKTRRGRRVHEEILGFREFLSRVEGDRLERDGRRTTATFERILPYAQVLGVADHWADVFADLYTAPPDWYVSTRPDAAFRPRVFVGDVGRALETMGRTVASRPSGGSGVSGLGGGGFSGGGFGGGGGGSW